MNSVQLHMTYGKQKEGLRGVMPNPLMNADSLAT